MDLLLHDQGRCLPERARGIRNMREHYVYILASRRNGTLYVGMTEDLGKRMVRHKDKSANQFTAEYDVKKLVYYERQRNLEEAVKREKQLKKWRREWKLKLIEKQNPEWEDLFCEILRQNLNTGSPDAKPK
jgi:putative endonuclease